MCSQVLTSKDVRVQGLMGPAAPIEKKNAPVSDGAVGMGGTNAWKLASMVTRFLAWWLCCLDTGL